MYILFLIISLLQIVLVLDYVEIVLKRRFLPLNARVQHLRNFQLSVCQSYKLFSCAGLRIKKNSRETGSRNCPGIRIFQIVQVVRLARFVQTTKPPKLSESFLIVRVAQVARLVQTGRIV